jgi:hypothetical protein
MAHDAKKPFSLRRMPSRMIRANRIESKKSQPQMQHKPGIAMPALNQRASDKMIYGGGNTPGSMTDKWPWNGSPTIFFQITS